MNPLYFIGVGVACAAAGFFAGWKLRERKAKKEMNTSLAFHKHQLDSLDKKYKELKNSINANIAEKEKVWSDISKGQDAEKEDEPKGSSKLEAELMHKRPESERTNYNAITSGLKYADMEEEPSDSIIRWESETGIVEVQEREYWESKEYIDEELEYYEATCEVWKDGALLDDQEVQQMLGYSKDELRARMLYDEPKTIYIRNPGMERFYLVHWNEGMRID